MTCTWWPRASPGLFEPLRRASNGLREEYRHIHGSIAWAKRGKLRRDCLPSGKQFRWLANGIPAYPSDARLH